ncbi:hypothetical protein BDZ45DRAFT_727698 [Acephala macrosclerotiorum]|nr:hypothetical protein BDZ45DRAFT_727698 [Acephala macrosclerotiorum]
MERVPQELLAHIASYLSPGDLKNVRLSSRYLKPSADRTLFRDVHLYLNLDSFERLESISEHDILRKYVTSIEYNACSVDVPWHGLGYQTWLERYAATNFAIEGSQRQEFLARLDVELLQGIHEEFCRYIAGQHYLERQDHDRKLLSAAMTKLPRLQRIRFCQRSSLTRSPASVLQGDPAQPLTNKILAIPVPVYANATPFWSLFAAARESHAPHITELHCGQLDLETWDDTASQYADHFESFSNLQSLNLDFEMNLGDPSIDDLDAPNLKKLLLCLPLLRSLSLSFQRSRVDFLDHGLMSLSLVFGNTHTWESLRNLSLVGFSTTSQYLQAFLGRCSAIQSLELANACLTGLQDSDLEFWDANSQAEESPSWISLFLFLKQSLSLERVKLWGWFINRRNEAWVAHYNDEEPSASSSFTTKPHSNREDDRFQSR